MPHHVRAIVERELSQMDWSRGRSREALLEHFRMAPTVRQLLADHLPDRTFHSAREVMEAVPAMHWDWLERAIQHGTTEHAFLQSRVASMGGRQSPEADHGTREATGQSGPDPGA